MAIITKTKIATSQPLDLCKGLPIWPSLGALSLGMSRGGRSGPLIQTTPQVMWYKFGVDVSFDFFAGICGPAFAIGMDLEGETDGSSLTLNVSDDELQAGMVAGVKATFDADLTLEQYDMFQGWKNDFHLSAGIDLDVLGLFIDLIIWVMENGAAKSDADMKPFPGYAGYWSIFGNSFKSLGYNEKSVAVPKLYLPINIVPQIEPLEAINLALHALVGELSMGPTIWFGIPVSVGVSAIALDNVTYGNIRPSGTGTLLGSTTGVAPEKPTTLKVTLAHDAGFDFGIGFHAEVSVLKIFSLSGGIDVSLLSLFGIAIHGETYTNDLQNTIGSDAIDKACSTCGLETQKLRVVLDPESR